MIVKYAELLIRWRWLVIITAIIAVGGVASGGRFLGFTTDYRAFFSPDNPELRAFEALQASYDRADNVVFLITPADGHVFTNQTLTSIKWLTEKAWQVPYSTRVDSITNYQHSQAFGDDLVVGDLVQDPSAASSADLSQIEKIALNEPLIVKRIINEDASVTGINVTIHLPGKSMTEVPEVAAYVRNLARELEARDPNLQVGLTGMVMFNNAFGENARQDMTTLVPLMFLAIIILLGLFFRSVSATIATTLMLFMSILAGMGAFGWTGYKLTPPSASAPNIILTIAVAHTVHFLITFLATMRAGGDKESSIVESLRVNFQPIFLTSLTTVIGFLALNTSDVPPIVHLGNIVAAGVTAAFVLSVTFLPAFIAVMPVRVKARPDKTHTIFDIVSRTVSDNYRLVLFGTLALTLVFVAFIPNNEINDDFVTYFDESTEFRQDTDYAIENLIGPNNIQYALQADESGGVNEPAFLADVQKFVDYLHTQKEVHHVYAITQTMKRLNRNMHGDSPAWHRLPDEREIAAQYLLLYEMSLPYGLNLNNQVNLDKSATRVTIAFDAMTTKQMLGVEHRFDLWLKENLPHIRFEASSSNLMFSHIGQRSTRSMISGALIAIILISTILVIVLRSFKIGFISLIPNLIPIGIAFGIWGLMIGEVGLSLAPVVSMTLGIVVDDTIHFLSKYLRGRREQNLDAGAAIQYAFRQVGSALTVTTFVLVAGFMVLTLSPFRLNSDMGLLTAITIAVALVVDFLLLPSLLMAVDKDRPSNQPSGLPASSAAD
ncbi:MMPL family protein [Rhodobiaceae bacterium]|nr:MMPL family protein [Rhodobiaceae bacterium]